MIHGSTCEARMYGAGESFKIAASVPAISVPLLSLDTLPEHGGEPVGGVKRGVASAVVFLPGTVNSLRPNVGQMF